MKAKWIGFVIVLLMGALPAWAQAQSQVCIPQYLNGGDGAFRWETTLILQNRDQKQARVQLHFSDPDGEPLGDMMMREHAGRGSHQQVGPDGQFSPGRMAGTAARSYRSSGEGPFQSGYCVIESQEQIQAHARLHLLDGSGNPISETSIIPGAQFRAGSLFVDQTGNRQLGLALTNLSPDQTATVTLEIFREDETVPLGTLEVQLGPRAQITRLLMELFPEILAGDVGYILISSDHPVCGLALQLRGLEILQVPIFILTEEVTP